MGMRNVNDYEIINDDKIISCSTPEDNTCIDIFGFNLDIKFLSLMLNRKWIKYQMIYDNRED